eukprot:Rmarinus@m.13903
MVSMVARVLMVRIAVTAGLVIRCGQSCARIRARCPPTVTATTVVRLPSRPRVITAQTAQTAVLASLTSAGLTLPLCACSNPSTAPQHTCLVHTSLGPRCRALGVL